MRGWKRVVLYALFTVLFAPFFVIASPFILAEWVRNRKKDAGGRAAGATKPRKG